jgi:hypothetical protein
MWFNKSTPTAAEAEKDFELSISDALMHARLAKVPEGALARLMKSHASSIERQIAQRFEMRNRI